MSSSEHNERESHRTCPKSFLVFFFCPQAVEYEGIKIFHFSSPIYFANSDLYVKTLKEKVIPTPMSTPISPDIAAVTDHLFQTGVNPEQVQAIRKSLQKQKASGNHSIPSLQVGSQVRLLCPFAYLCTDFVDTANMWQIKLLKCVSVGFIWPISYTFWPVNRAKRDMQYSVTEPHGRGEREQPGRGRTQVRLKGRPGVCPLHHPGLDAGLLHWLCGS